MLQDIPFFVQWIKVEEIHKGWSANQKFYVEDTTGEKFLLRLSKRDTYEKKKQEFEAMEKACGLDVLMSKPITFGICRQGEYVYALFTWIERLPADEMIQSLSIEKQYEEVRGMVERAIMIALLQLFLSGYGKIVSAIWQTQPFREGNTRTISTFLIKYL